MAVFSPKLTEKHGQIAYASQAAVFLKIKHLGHSLKPQRAQYKQALAYSAGSVPQQHLQATATRKQATP
jgi:hypothetical protein